MSKSTLAIILLSVFFLLAMFSCSKPTEPEVATPSFNPPGGTYDTPLCVTITCETLLATIYYTLDGTNPNSGSTVYSGPIDILRTTTFKAKAAREGMLDSKIASATYTFENFVWVAGGTFNNGTSDVTVSSFYMGKYELTQAGYEAVMGYNPAQYGPNGVGSNYPVYNVSWYHAIEYSNRRSLQEGLTPCYSYSSYGTNPANWPSGWNTNDNNHTNVNCNWTANGYRLPTEAEWEFAARGGNQTHNYSYSGSNEINAVAWYSSNSGNTTHTVRIKTANELGLYDMSGNVYEWNWDIYGSYPSGSQTNPHGAPSGSYRVLRGGSWFNNALYCTVSHRGHDDATASGNVLGFRLCRVSP